MPARTRRAGTVTLLVTVSALACAQAVAWVPSPGSTSTVTTAGVSGSSLTPAAMTAVGLYPGRTVTATVSITNNGEAPVVLTVISAGSSDAVGDCPAGAVSSSRMADAAGLLQSDGLTRVLAPDEIGTWSVPVTMPAPAQTACAARDFSLPIILSSQVVS